MQKNKVSNLVLANREKITSFYYKDVCNSMHISMNWLIKLPFHTVRWAYFQIIRRYSYLPEDKRQDAMTNLEKWFKTEVFDEKGNLRPYKGRG